MASNQDEVVNHVIVQKPQIVTNVKILPDNVNAKKEPVEDSVNDVLPDIGIILLMAACVR